MPFFGRGRDDGTTELPPGSDGVPSAAEQRLAEITDGDFFTSTLSVGEFALLSLWGPKPISQVMGASFHQVGWQYLPPSAQWGGEVYTPLTSIMQAWEDARHHAFARMIDEAKSVGADAVVGVKLKRGEHDWARKSVEYVVTGTAIKTGSTPDSGDPVLSDLTVQQYWKLASAGWAPAGLVAVTSVYFIAQSIGTTWRRRLKVASNQELTEYSRGFSVARKRAVEMLGGQASALRAVGVVGVEFDHRITREKLDVAKVYGYQGQLGYRAPGQSPMSLVAGGQPANQGRDSRSGIVVTIQATGTAIRRQQRVALPAPQAVMRAGMPV